MAKFDLNNYVDVATRIDEFYKRDPEGRILTELLNVGWQGKQTQFIVKAYLYNGDTLLATGLAEESLGGAGANATAALENAETSAIGRATSNLNFVNTVSGKRQRATREEMAKVNRGSTDVTQVPLLAELKSALSAKFPESPDDRKFLVEAKIGRSVSGLTDLTETEMSTIINYIRENA